MRARRNRGFTLIELAVSTAVGMFITLAAVTFLSQQAQAYGVTQGSFELTESSRYALEHIAQDLRRAGTGMTYDEAGVFRGIDAPPSFSRGAAVFTSDQLNLPTGNATDDLGLIFADGDAVTLAAYDAGGTAEVCRGHRFTSGDVLLFRSEDGLSSRTVLLGSVATNIACTVGQCVAGCDGITWGAQAQTTYESGTSAAAMEYTGGTAFGGVRQVTWFVDGTDPARPGVGRLRRAEGPCTARDRTCGQLVADFVEALHVRRYEWTGNAWVDITGRAAGPTSGARLRVDVELVARARSTSAPERPPVIDLQLEPGRCVPASCAIDGFARRVLRTSVEIKNAGRGRYRR